MRNGDKRPSRAISDEAIHGILELKPGGPACPEERLRWFIEQGRQVHRVLIASASGQLDQERARQQMDAILNEIVVAASIWG